MTLASIDTSKVWYVCRTNIKCEGKAAYNIQRAGFDAYVPRFRAEKFNKRTNTYREIERPLMLRYLFVGLDRGAQHFGFVRACEGVEAILGDMGRPVPVPASFVSSLFEAEMDMRWDDTRAARIHRKEEAKTRKATVQMRFPKGKLLQIVEGPFTSYYATADSVTTRGEVETLVEIFGRMTPVTVFPSQVVDVRAA